MSKEFFKTPETLEELEVEVLKRFKSVVHSDLQHMIQTEVQRQYEWLLRSNRMSGVRSSQAKLWSAAADRALRAIFEWLSKPTRAARGDISGLVATYEPTYLYFNNLRRKRGGK